MTDYEDSPDPFAMAEAAFLGCMLFDPHVASLATDILKADHFLDPVTRAIFETAVGLLSEGATPNPVTIAARLEGYGEFRRAGGLRYLAELLDAAPPAANARDYAEVIRDGWKRRSLSEIATLAAAAANTRGDVPVDEIVAGLEARLLEIQEHSKGVRLIDTAEAVETMFAEMEGTDVGYTVDTGIEKLDEAIGGMAGGELWILAGRPSMGKSAVASCVALNVSRHAVRPDGRRVGVIEISAEMTVAALTRRHVSDWAYELAPKDAPAYSAIRRHRKKPLPPEQMSLVQHVGSLLSHLRTLRLVRKTGITLSALRGLIRRQVAQWKREGIELGLVVLDHGGLVRSDNPRASRYEAQSEVSLGLKEMAGDFGVPFLVLLQLSRQVEQRDDKKPTLPDLRDSGTWEENADGVIGVYREAYYAQRETKPTKANEVLAWEDKKASRTVEAIFLKIREGNAGVAELFGDMGRNAIRSSRPDNAYGMGAEFVSPGGSSLFAAANEGAKSNARPAPDDDPVEADDDRDAYLPEEFA